MKRKILIINLTVQNLGVEKGLLLVLMTHTVVIRRVEMQVNLRLTNEVKKMMLVEEIIIVLLIPTLGINLRPSHQLVIDRSRRDTQRFNQFCALVA